MLKFRLATINELQVVGIFIDVRHANGIIRIVIFMLVCFLLSFLITEDIAEVKQELSQASMCRLLLVVGLAYVCCSGQTYQ